MTGTFHSIGIGFIELLFLVLLLVGAILVARRLFYPRAARSARALADLPVCGKCGYVVRGIAALHCPECGADLREVGIVTPSQRGTGGAIAWALFWSVAVLILGLVSSPVIFSALPTLRTVGVYEFNLQPSAARYRSLDITITEKPVPAQSIRFGSTTNTWVGSGSHTLSLPRGSASPPIDRADIALRTNQPGSPSSLAIPAAGGSYTPPNAAAPVRVDWPPTEAQLARWLTDLGITPDPAETVEIALLLSDIANNAPTATLTRFLGLRQHATTRTIRIQWPGPALLACWVVVWTVGLIFLIRRRRPTSA